MRDFLKCRDTIRHLPTTSSALTHNATSSLLQSSAPLNILNLHLFYISVSSLFRYNRGTKKKTDINLLSIIQTTTTLAPSQPLFLPIDHPSSLLNPNSTAPSLLNPKRSITPPLTPHRLLLLRLTLTFSQINL